MYSLIFWYNYIIQILKYVVIRWSIRMRLVCSQASGAVIGISSQVKSILFASYCKENVSTFLNAPAWYFSMYICFSLSLLKRINILEVSFPSAVV